MSNLKDQLVKLGSKRKDLRPHIRPILAELGKQERVASRNLFREIIDYRGLASIMSPSRNQGDKRIKKMFGDIFEYFSERLELERGEEQAFNRLEQLIDQAPEGDRLLNQLAKIADLLGLKTPVTF